MTTNKEGEAKLAFSNFRVPRFLRFNPIRALIALGAVGFLAGCASTTIDTTKAVAVEVEGSGQPFFPIRATLITNPDYCKNPSNQDTSAIVLASTPDHLMSVGAGVKVECRPNHKIIPEVIFTTVPLGKAPQPVTSSEIIGLAIKPGDIVDFVIDNTINADLQVLMRNKTTGMGAASRSYPIPANSLTSVVVLDGKPNRG